MKAMFGVGSWLVFVGFVGLVLLSMLASSVVGLVIAILIVMHYLIFWAV